MELLDSGLTMERIMMKNAKRKKIPINGSIELLPLCNMKCKMCYARLDYKEMQKEGRLRTVDEWLELGRMMQEQGVLFLLLTGGEPLIYPQFKEVYLGLREMGFVISINTNGTLIDEVWASFFGKYKPRRINITLYGASNDTYRELCGYEEGFDRTIRAIKLLKENLVDVKVAGSITKLNVQDIEQFFEIGKLLDVPVKLDSYMLPVKNKDEEHRLEPKDAARVMLQQLKYDMDSDVFAQLTNDILKKIDIECADFVLNNIRCMAGSSSFSINWKGEMKPCIIWPNEGVKVFTTGFKKAWEHIERQCGVMHLSEKCSKCRKYNVCRTCVVAEMLEEEKGVAPSYLCKFTEEFIELLRKEGQYNGK